MPPANFLSNKNSFSLSALLFVWLFVSYGYFFQAGEHNENARYDQIRAIVEDQSFAIDRFAFNTADVVRYNDKTYPNKPPGAVFAALPAWYFAKTLLSPFAIEQSLREHLWCYLTSLFSIALCGALTGVLLFRFLLQSGSSRYSALMLTLGYGLGTIAFPFSTVFFSHQLATCLIFCGYLLALKAINGEFNRRLLFCSGILAGLSVSVDYPSAIAVLLIAAMLVWALIANRRINDQASSSSTLATLFTYCGGVVISTLTLLVYNWLVFDSPLFLTYSLYAQGEASGVKAFPGHRLGFMGIRWPDLATLYQITFGTQRGLFVFNPWLLAIIPALIICRGRSLARITAIAISAAFLAFNAGYGDSIVYWGGGHSVGPRHLLPALPFFVIVIAPLVEKRSWAVLVSLLLLVSVLIMLMATAVEPRIAYRYQNPIFDFLWPNFKVGQLSLLNTGIFNQQLITADSVAFNWGELLQLPAGAQLLPLLAFWLASAIVWIRLKAT